MYSDINGKVMLALTSGTRTPVCRNLTVYTAALSFVNLLPRTLTATYTTTIWRLTLCWSVIGSMRTPLKDIQVVSLSTLDKIPSLSWSTERGNSVTPTLGSWPTLPWKSSLLPLEGDTDSEWSTHLLPCVLLKSPLKDTTWLLLQPTASPFNLYKLIQLSRSQVSIYRFLWNLHISALIGKFCVIKTRTLA